MGNEPKFGRGHAGVQLAAAFLSGGVVWLTAADLGNDEVRAGFVEFFATSAAVIAALLIALSIEARAAFPLKAYAIIAPACLAIGEVSAVAALSPALPDEAYRWLMALTVGGGLGGLVAVVWAAKKLLQKEVEAHRVDELIAAGARTLEEKKRREKAAAGQSGSGNRGVATRP